MEPSDATYDALLERLVAWATARSDVRGAAIVGSRARTEQAADEWSDLDIVLLVRNPELFLSSADWLNQIGTVWLTCSADVEGQAFRAAWFQGDAKVDFVIASSRAMRIACFGLRLLTRHPRLRRLLPEAASNQLATFSKTIARGMRVILDKDGWLYRMMLLPPLQPPDRPPTAPEFVNAVNTFRSWSLWSAKLLCRGELWRATYACDSELKQMLLQMLEWRSRAERGWKQETWYLGRFIEQWADPRSVAEMRDTFAHYEHSDVGRALLATMQFYNRIAKETAGRLALEYPEAEEAVVAQHIEETLSGLKTSAALAQRAE